MERVSSHTATEALRLPPANDSRAGVPLDRPRAAYRHVALRSDGARGNAAAAIVALAFCLWWVGLRDASPAEVAEVRARVATAHGQAALARFDGALGADADHSLIGLHLLRL
ncbi:MAG: hypothetical protein ACLGI7_17275 [Gammaproteobacteria bacterium]